jgi:sugar lactone lactonase YvrE
VAFSEPWVLLDDLMYAEGPRWRDRFLYVSDFTAQEVVRVDLDGNRDTFVHIEGQPSGTGWMPNGDMLIVSITDARLLRFDGASLSEVADVSATSPCANDLVVDSLGRAYMGGMPATVKGSLSEHLYMVKPGAVGEPGDCRIVASDLQFPNGAVITADGRTLIVAESGAKLLTAFDIQPDGTLDGRRVWADIGEVPDGVCLDAENRAWVAVPRSENGAGFLRVAEGGEILEKIPSDRSAMAPMLGGPDGLHLFMVETTVVGRGDIPEIRMRGNSGVRVAIVDVPAAGLP